MADGLNGLISLGRGDYVGAGLSFVSMVPIFGDIVGKGGKITRYAVKYSDEAAVAMKELDNGASRIWSQTVVAPARVAEARTLTQQRELARITGEVREELTGNFDALARELSPNQIRAIAEEPWRMHLYFGTALEGRVASRVDDLVQTNAGSVLSDLRWTGRSNAPQDFIGATGHGFDITGGSMSSIRSHFARPEVNAVITYDSIPNDLGYRFIKWFNAQ